MVGNILFELKISDKLKSAVCNAKQEYTIHNWLKISGRVTGGQLL
jgi:hypothetical protein